MDLLTDRQEFITVIGSTVTLEFTPAVQFMCIYKVERNGILLDYPYRYNHGDFSMLDARTIILPDGLIAGDQLLIPYQY